MFLKIALFLLAALLSVIGVQKLIKWLYLKKQYH